MNRTFLLITANVGSLFDEKDSVEPFWVDTVTSAIVKCNPAFVAIHFQEIGGKCYHQYMGKVKRFIEKFRERVLLSVALSVGVCFLDEEFQNDEKFTALGSLFMIHKQIAKDVKIWNFKSSVFTAVEGFSVYESDLDHVPVVERIKFSADYFPEGKLTRKGVLRTRWKLLSKEVDLVNIHLFHDACNLVASESSPSIYSEYRKKALEFTLSRIRDNNMKSQQPMFMFGDLNFRLDAKSVIEKLLLDSDSVLHEQSNGKLQQYKQNASEEIILQLSKKEFSLNTEYVPNYKTLLEFDKERHEFAEIMEPEISFMPSYPYNEDPALPATFMKTRIPAWCDRVLLNKSAWDWLSSCSKDVVTYSLVGEDVCTGDHKPVLLAAELPQCLISSRRLHCSFL